MYPPPTPMCHVSDSLWSHILILIIIYLLQRKGKKKRKKTLLWSMNTNLLKKEIKKGKKKVPTLSFLFLISLSLSLSSVCVRLHLTLWHNFSPPICRNPNFDTRRSRSSLSLLLFNLLALSLNAARVCGFYSVWGATAATA